VKVEVIGVFDSHIHDEQCLGSIWVEDGYEMQCDICAEVAVCMCISSSPNASDGRICKKCAIKSFEDFGVGEVEGDYLNMNKEK